MNQTNRANVIWKLKSMNSILKEVIECLNTENSNLFFKELNEAVLKERDL